MLHRRAQPPLRPLLLHSPITLSNLSPRNLFSIKFLGVPVPRETQVDPSVLAFSLSLHQHPFIYVFPLSLALSINNKRGEKVRVYKKQIFPCISVVTEVFDRMLMGILQQTRCDEQVMFVSDSF